MVADLRFYEEHHSDPFKFPEDTKLPDPPRYFKFSLFSLYAKIVGSAPLSTRLSSKSAGLLVAYYFLNLRNLKSRLQLTKNLIYFRKKI